MKYLIVITVLLGIGYSQCNESNWQEYYNSEGHNMEGCDLEGANFFGADLSDANLENSNLSDANLSAATLNYANLNENKIIYDKSTVTVHADPGMYIAKGKLQLYIKNIHI